MKSAYLLSLLLLAPTLQAGVDDMQKALAHWEQQMTEYEAALEVAETPEQREAVLRPQGVETAKLLWKAVSGKTGSRKVTVKGEGDAKPTERQVSTYEFEEAWAAPAVAWLLSNPGDFAAALADKPRHQAFFAEALLDSVERIHFNNPAIRPACAGLMTNATRRTYSLLHKIFRQNPDPSTRACAALGVSLMLGDPLISGTEGTAEEILAKRVYYLKQAVALAPEGLTFGNASFDETVGELTYLLTNLSVGSVPPQLHLTDANGKAATLPVPGKCHLLYFWAPTGDAAFSAVAHMEKVKDSYPDLVICPITAHQESDSWTETLSQHGISACYTDDEKTTAATAYRITQVPTAVLLNERCRIVYIGAPGLELQTAILKFTKEKGKPAKTTPKQGNGHVIIEDAPAPKPKEEPATEPAQKDSTPPALRDMPEF